MRLTSRLTVVIAGLLLTGWKLPNVVCAQQWGSISGRFVFEGESPDPVPLSKIIDPAKARDPSVCKIGEMNANDLLIDPESKGIANVLVYLRRAKVVHPDLAKSMEPEVIFDQKGCRFIPHVMFVHKDQAIRVLSDDPIPHNTHTNTIRNQPQNFLVAANDRKGTLLNFRSGEPVPIPVNCDIHAWMKAYWLILDHPYAAVTDEQGRFTIRDLPAGEHSFRVWHERPGYIDRKYKVVVNPNVTTELETIRVPAEKFEG